MVHTVTFDQAMLAKDRVFAIRAGAYTSSDIKEASFNYGYISGDTFKPGGTVAGSAKLTFTSIITSFNKLDKVYPEIGLKVGNSFEWVATGEYFVNDINIDRNRNTTELDLMDGMFKLNQPYISDLTYPAQIRDVIREICAKTGVELETDNLGFRAIQHHVQSKADKKDITFREVLSQAIQLLGFSAFFNRKGKLEIRGLTESNITITADNYFLHGLTKSELMYQIAGITCKKDKETLTVGLRTGRSLELENSFMIQNILDDLYYDLKNIRYYPYSLDWQGHLKLDVGQWVTLKTNKNEVFKLPVLSQSFSFQGGLKSKISADSKAGNDTQYSYKGFLGKRIEQMSTEIEAEVQQQLEYKDKEFDEKINKAKSEINDGIEQSKADAEAYADNIKQQIDVRLAESDRQYQQAKQAQDRQIADVLAKTNLAKQLAEQAKADLAQTRTNLTQLIGQANTKANQLEQSLGSVRTDVMSQARSLLAQAQAQTALTNRVSTVEILADDTRSTVTELSKTVNKATGDIASVTSRTKTVEDSLSQTRTQYEALTQAVNGHTGQIDSINRRTADLQSGIDGVTERFEALRGGARNYAEDYDFSRGMWEYSQGDSSATERSTDNGIYTLTTTTNTWHQLQIHSESGNRFGGKLDSTALLDLEVGETYTLSVEVKANSGSPKFWLELRDNGLSNYNGVVTHLGGSGNVISATSEWVRYSVTGTIKLNSDFGHRRIILGYNEIGSISFRKVELSRGPKPMDTGPAVEDTEGRVETLRSELGTYIRNATENSAELVRRIETADGKAVDAKTYAQQTAAAINTRLESLETYKNAEGTRASQYFTASRDETARQVTALRTAVTDGYVAKAKYEEDARGVTQRFESLQVGGRNYIRNFGFTDSSYTLNNNNSQWRYKRIADPTSRSGYHVKATCTQAGSGGFHRPFVDLRGAHWQGRTMTYAVDVKCSRAVTIGIGAEAIESGIKNQSVSTEWQRFAVTGKVKYISTWSFVFYIRNTQWQVGDVVYIRDPQLEDGTMATTPSLAPEDQQSYADTKIAEYSNTVDGRFATMQSQVSGKANQVDLQTVRETVNLYERIIGSTETGIKDKIARIVMADSLFQTEVKDAISGTATQVSQLAGSWAVKNLTSNGQILNQINLLANGTNRIDGRLTHITGQTLIDNGVIKNAMIGNLDAGKITTGFIGSARIAANSITGNHMVFDQAFVNKMTANEALYKQLFAQSAFITSVQAVTMSAGQIVGGVLKATNGAAEFDLNNAKLAFNSSATIEFNSSGNALIRKVGDVTGFLHFNNAAAGGTYVGLGVTSHNEGVKSQNTGRFAGIRIFRSNDTTDQTEIYGDKIYLGHGFNGNGITITATKLSTSYELVDVINSVRALWRCWLHWNGTGWNPDDMAMRRSVINEYNTYNIG
ncbi:gp58-like family protein [Streptococcus suis]|uniref:gp58-like family protein n=1 Tax=Streptococcus suis TaxID=1307 RepID=UPI00300FFB53